ncbi:hypothetical protein QGN29_01735 [Temperatibacter marinus]|uniref:Dihydroorotase n=1 Tax=Temperatibacter marinus TaxID=1456591 RepID=A0AA52EHW4_9PROT|nr:hypothetical protein [Temperatibacter marinus]WND03085.1 hypothetical protein QGN29_01735 [Temperatibacter marinus]
MTLQITLPHWYDLHTHFRQDETVRATVADHVKMGCIGALAMPNTKPPVGKVFEKDDVKDYKSVEAYRQEIMTASGGVFQEVIVPLYITRDIKPEMITAGAKKGVLKACKYYPPHGTTGADFGAPFDMFMENGVFAAMEESGVTLCIHGEEHGLSAEKYFDRGENAEELFYANKMPLLIRRFPKLRVVAEHLTTKVAVDFVKSAPEHVKATVTPQHLMYTIGTLLQGLKYHLYCLPLLKFDEDRLALRQAVTDPENTKFFAGTDSAPHVKKVTPCGCAAGCYTGGIAPQLYAQAFEMAGVDLSIAQGQEVFRKFLCEIGQTYYDLPKAQGTFTIEKTAENIKPLAMAGETIIPLPLGMDTPMTWSIV